MEERRDGPYSVFISDQKHDDFYLSNVEWHRNDWYGDHPQYETGVRPVRCGVILNDHGDFTLIQHGWYDFERADQIILKGLRKGWDALRISRLIEWMSCRRRPAPSERRDVARA